MSDITFVDPSSIDRPPSVVIGLAGATSSGKTYSALLLAQGFAKARGGPVLVADSDNGRVLDYAHGPYPHLKPFKWFGIEPPFTSEKYEAILTEADKQNPGAIVIDNITDEWEGTDGVLERQQALALRMAKGDESRLDKMQMAAWAKIKPAHKRLMRTIGNLQTPTIICFRAELDKVSLDTKGKPQVTPIVPAGDERMQFYCRFFLLMKQYGNGEYAEQRKIYEHEDRLFPNGGRIDPETVARVVEHFYGAPPKAGSVTDSKAASPHVHRAPLWKLRDDGRLECHGDTASTEAQRDLYVEFKKILNPETNKTKAQRNITRLFIHKNGDLIEGLPDAGKSDIQRIVLELMAKDGDEQ